MVTWPSKFAIPLCVGIFSSHSGQTQNGVFMNGLFPQAIRLLAGMLSLHLSLTSGFLARSATAEEKPAWQQGISTWNGKGYESQAASDKAVRFPLPTTENSPHAYIIPSDPNAVRAARSMSAKHFAQNPTGPEILTSPARQKPLTLPIRTADIPTVNIQPNPNALPNRRSTGQSQLRFPTDGSMPIPTASNELGSSNPIILSSLPSNALDDLLKTNTESLNADTTEHSDSDNQSGPSPQTNSAPETSPPATLQPENASGAARTDSSQVTTGTAEPSPQTDPTTIWDSSEPAPLQTEVARWYQYPRAWIKGWDSHAEFGLDGSGGNADTLAMQAGLELKRKTDRYTFGMDINYRQASSRKITTEQNGRFNINFDRLMGATPWSAFAKHGMEWDKFKPFDLRLNLNGGVGYYWQRSDASTFATRFGAGASREIGAPIDDWIPEAVFGVEAERQVTSRQKLKGKIDYFPAWENFGDYRLVSDVSWEILLDGTENLSLKLAATDRYDSTPQGAKPNDIYYSLLLLYKF